MFSDSCGDCVLFGQLTDFATIGGFVNFLGHLGQLCGAKCANFVHTCFPDVLDFIRFFGWHGACKRVFQSGVIDRRRSLG